MFTGQNLPSHQSLFQIDPVGAELLSNHQR
jgi:hypothetical protein